MNHANFEVAKTKGSLPTLHLNPYSWTKVSSIIYLDSPAGVGFSYSNNETDYVTGDIKTASNSHAFFLKVVISVLMKLAGGCPSLADQLNVMHSWSKLGLMKKLLPALLDVQTCIILTYENECHVERRSSNGIESPLALRREVLETGTLSIFVLGASGDLAKKKTFPTLFHLYKQELLPSNEVHVFGYARSKISTDKLRNNLRNYLIPKKGVSPKDLHDVSDFLQLVKYISGGYDSEEGFRLLDREISEHEYLKNSKEGSSRRLFYLTLPPSVYPSVCKMIKTYCMNKSDVGGWTHVIVEKPFGRDLESAEELSYQIGELFEEPQIYRIDHYLGKELVQNMLVLRFANRFFLPLWNRDNIDNVQIVFREDFGTEGRGGYFDQYRII